MHYCVHDAKRTLLSFKDIRVNGFHVETELEQDNEYLLITKLDGYQKQVVAKTPFVAIWFVLYV